MKYLITTIAAVVLVGCGESQSINNIHNVAAYQDAEALKKVLDSGVNINKKNLLGMTALHEAVDKNNLQTFEFLLSRDADVNAADIAGTSPLHMVSQLGNLDLAKKLLSKGAKVNAKQLNGKTPLLFAVDFGKLDIAELLIQNNANVNDADNNKWTILHAASQGGYVNIVKKIVSIDSMKINLKEKMYGMTPLHSASAFGHNETIELLLTKNASINMADNHGNTALDFAKMKNQDSTILLLRKHGGKTAEELKAAGN